jgi:hypothetical protein
VRFRRDPAHGRIVGVYAPGDDVFTYAWLRDPAVSALFAAQDRARRLARGATPDDEAEHERQLARARETRAERLARHADGRRRVLECRALIDAIGTDE